MHRISDNRMSGSLMKNLEMFTSLCGQKAMPNVIIATTMWGEVKQETGARREKELKGEFWKDMLKNGGRTMHFGDSWESAWEIIGDLSRKGPANVQVAREMVDAGLLLNETQAGVTLNKELEKLIRDRKDAAVRLKKQVGSQHNSVVVEELQKQQREIDKKIETTAQQLRNLKIPFSRRVRFFFLGRPKVKASSCLGLIFFTSD